MALKRHNEVIIIKVRPTSYMITNNSLEVDIESVHLIFILMRLIDSETYYLLTKPNENPTSQNAKYNPTTTSMILSFLN